MNKQQSESKQKRKKPKKKKKEIDDDDVFLDSCIAENQELIEIAEMPSDKVALDITELFTHRLSDLN